MEKTRSHEVKTYVLFFGISCTLWVILSHTKDEVFIWAYWSRFRGLIVNGKRSILNVIIHVTLMKRYLLHGGYALGDTLLGGRVTKTRHVLPHLWALTNILLHIPSRMRTCKGLSLLSLSFISVEPYSQGRFPRKGESHS